MYIIQIKSCCNLLQNIHCAFRVFEIRSRYSQSTVFFKVFSNTIILLPTKKPVRNTVNSNLRMNTSNKHFRSCQLAVCTISAFSQPHFSFEIEYMLCNIWNIFQVEVVVPFYFWYPSRSRTTIDILNYKYDLCHQSASFSIFHLK